MAKKDEEVVEVVEEAVEVVEEATFDCDNCEDSGRICYKCNSK